MDREATEDVLIEQARAGSHEAFEILIERYRSRMLRLAVRFTRNLDDAQEVVQEVSLAVFQKLYMFEGKSAFSTWLYRVAVNTALMKLRSRNKAETVPIHDLGEDQFPDESDSESPDDRLITQQSLDQIEQAMEGLPLDFKTVLILRDIEDFSNEETAEILDLSVAAVKSRLHRARAILRKRLADLYRTTRGN